ncbi:MAG: sulfotransferase domain-containing protein [Chloroflexota bacterium]
MSSDPKCFKLQFVGVGPKRTGTTWTHEVLEPHPQICLPKKIKETMFFDLYHDKGAEWYQSHFSCESTDQLCGEVGPSYFNSGPAVERIYHHNPKCKILINIRNPLEHVLSLYQHELSNGVVTGPFWEAIEKAPQVLGAGHYAHLVPLWQKKFGKDNVAFIWIDQIKTNPQMVYTELCSFLGISDHNYPARIADKKINRAQSARSLLLSRFGLKVYYWLRENRLHSLMHLAKYAKINKIFFSSKDVNTPKFTDKEKAKLLELYEADITYLESETDRNLSTWRTIG